MIAGIARGAPNTGYAELTASAIFIVKGAINLAPGMGAANFNPPAMFFSIP
jgi:hypothetical protein